MEILKKTMDYLLNLLDRPYDDRLLGLYNFLWDRMRAIRMDLRMQHLFNLGAITMLEQMRIQEEEGRQPTEHLENGSSFFLHHPRHFQLPKIEESPRSSVASGGDWRYAFDSAADGPSSLDSRFGSNGQSHGNGETSENGHHRPSNRSNSTGHRTPNRMPPSPPGSGSRYRFGYLQRTHIHMIKQSSLNTNYLIYGAIKDIERKKNVLRLCSRVYDLDGWSNRQLVRVVSRVWSDSDCGSHFCYWNHTCWD